MDWFFSIIRIAGASFPVASSFVQLQAEIDSKLLSERLSKLEDPISYLHDDMPEMSKLIYQETKNQNQNMLEFDSGFYQTYLRPLAILEKRGCIEGYHTTGGRFWGGFALVDPTYTMYMCALAENPKKMESLFALVDQCEINTWLDGAEISTELDLPVPTVRAVFEIFESKGYGFLSKELGKCQYYGSV